MADPITPIDPRPFVGQTVVLPDDATVVELDPQPFNNTKEIILLNLSETDDALAQITNLLVIPASAQIDLSTVTQLDDLIGDTVSIGATTFTGVVGSQTSGSDDFSVWRNCKGLVSVNAPALTPGDTISLFPPGGAEELDAYGAVIGEENFSEKYVLTGVSGPRAPGSRTFQVDGGSELAIALSIAAAVNDSNFASEVVANVGTSTVDLGDPPWGVRMRAAFRGDFTPVPTPETSVNDWGFVFNTATPGDLTGSWPESASDTGVDLVPAPGSPFALGGGAGGAANTEPAVIFNLAIAINDPANGTAGVVTARVDNDGSSSSGYPTFLGSFVTVFAVAPGTAGNGIPLSATGLFFSVTSPTAGGKDALPDAASVTRANSTVIPAGGAITYNVGSEGNRQPLADSTFWSTNPGSKLAVVLKAESGSNVEVNATFVQNRGYSEGV